MSTAGANARYDAIVVGGGHNGLVAAGYLARAGLRTIVLEQRDRAGGAVATHELAPGVRVPTLAHTVGRFSPRVARDLDLRGHGLRLVQPEARVFAPQPDGRAITLWGDPERTAAELRDRSAHDAAAYRRLDAALRRLGALMARLAAVTPPALAAPGLDDVRSGLQLARAMQALGRNDARAAFRALPMAVADYLGEWLETDALIAVIATRGIQHAFLGPRSPGTTAVLLAQSGALGGAAGETVVAVGGPGALADALVLAARAVGAEVRTGARVQRVLVKDERVDGVVLESGEELRAPVVAAGIDPKRLLLELLDPALLGPQLGWRVANLRMRGVTAKVNLVLDGLPVFRGAEGESDRRRLRGRIVVASGVDALERAFDAAKYGRMSGTPMLEATIPTLLDPGLAPEGTHVMSVIAQYAPPSLREGSWEGTARNALADTVLRTLEGSAPGLTARVRAREVVTPLDLEREYGMTGGHPLHGEPGLDQFFAWRPLLGCARYRMPVEGLYLCASGAHPGGGVTGMPGANAAREILLDRSRGNARSRRN